MSEKRICKALTRKGKACQAPPLKGKDLCSAHDPETPALTRFGSLTQARAAGRLGGRPRLPKPVDVARRLIEENVTVVLRPHFLTLGLELHADGSVTELESGAVMYGESKDGEIVASSYEDLGAQIAAAEKLLDRVYGRPKVTTEISGTDAVPVATSVVFDPELAAEARALLRRAAAA